MNDRSLLRRMNITKAHDFCAKLPGAARDLVMAKLSKKMQRQIAEGTSR